MSTDAQKPAQGAERFSFQPTEHFARKLDRLGKTDPPGFRRVTEVIERILGNPADADGMLHGEHRGMLKKYAGRADYRIVYRWCESCRKTRMHLANLCGLCGSIPDHSVVFIDLFHKSEYRKLDY